MVTGGRRRPDDDPVRYTDMKQKLIGLTLSSAFNRNRQINDLFFKRRAVRLKEESNRLAVVGTLQICREREHRVHHTQGHHHDESRGFTASPDGTTSYLGTSYVATMVLDY